MAKKRERAARRRKREMRSREGEHELNMSAGSVEFAQTEGSDDFSPPTFKMVAYTGQPMDVGFGIPVVLDLDGLAISRKARPVLRQHDPARIVGHTTNIDKSNGRLAVEGVVSGAGDDALEVEATSQAGFPWQASVGARVDLSRMEEVDKKSRVTVNGRVFRGPLEVARKSRLSELSFVPLGADDDTSAKVAAAYVGGLEIMTFAQWLEANGWDLESLSDKQEKQLLAQWELEGQSDQGDGEDSAPVPNNGRSKRAEDPSDKRDTSTQNEPVEAGENQTDEWLVSMQRKASIDTVLGQDPELAVQAFKDEWDEGRMKSELELKKLKAEKSLHADFSINSKKNPGADRQVLTAALCLSAGVDEESLLNPFEGVAAKDRKAFVGSDKLEKLTAQQIELAQEHYPAVGLQEMVLIWARQNGYTKQTWGDGRDALQAAFTSLDLPITYRDTLNRVLLEQYKFAENKWRLVTRQGSVRDFRQIERFRIHGTGHWERLSPDGELKHGQIEEGAVYKNQIETVGNMMMLTRVDFINDDVGALNNIAQMMTFYGLLAPEMETWRTLIAGLDNDGNAFFTAGNGNLATGAFGYDTLKDMWTLFKKMKDLGVTKDKAKRRPSIVVPPRIILTPVDLEIEVDDFLNAKDFQWTGPAGTTDVVADRNVTRNFFRGKLQQVSTPYLSDVGVHADASETAFYLLADPNFLPGIEILFLNGRQRPTIESVTPRPELLGVGFRGWLDFGVGLIDPKAIMMTPGT